MSNNLTLADAKALQGKSYDEHINYLIGVSNKRFNDYIRAIFVFKLYKKIDNQYIVVLNTILENTLNEMKLDTLVKKTLKPILLLSPNFIEKLSNTKLFIMTIKPSPEENKKILDDFNNEIVQVIKESRWWFKLVKAIRPYVWIIALVAVICLWIFYNNNEYEWYMKPLATLAAFIASLITIHDKLLRRD